MNFFSVIIRLWDTEKASEKYVCVGHNDVVQNITWNSTGCLMASSSKVLLSKSFMKHLTFFFFFFF
jgi:hypothetical protein